MEEIKQNNNWGQNSISVAAFLPAISLFILSFVDPVLHSNKWYGIWIFYIKNLKIEIVLFTIIVIALSPVVKKILLGIFQLGQSSYAKKIIYFFSFDFFLKYWHYAVSILVGIFLSIIIWNNQFIALGEGLSYRYFEVLPLKYRVELVDQAKEYEIDGQVEFALHAYKNIQESFPNLAEIGFVENRIGEISNRVNFSNYLYNCIQKDIKDFDRTDILYLMYASMLNPNNSIINSKIKRTVEHFEANSLNVDFLLPKVFYYKDMSNLTIDDLSIKLPSDTIVENMKEMYIQKLKELIKSN